MITPRTSRPSLLRPLWRLRLLFLIGCSSIFLKLLLFPAAHSTDLEVHRHWKALTFSRSLSHWYLDTSSQWTLDYPPLFAFFEYILARSIAPFNPRLVDISNHNDASPSVVYALRSTVLALDPVLLFAVFKYLNSYNKKNNFSHFHLLSIALVLLNPSLIIVDILHFQYNILPIALLFLSLSALNRFHVPLAAVFFALAVNTKHTLFPLALPLVIYVLSSLYHSSSFSQFSSLILIIRVAFSSLFVFLLPWIPFYSTGGLHLISQINTRLFPFHRGLLHANWAPNFWAVYAVLDKLLSRFGCNVRTPDVQITSGHIGALCPFVCLPNPTPSFCLTLTIIATTPAVLRLSRHPTPYTLARSVVVIALASVIFGWHVHEKALLVALLPLVAFSALTCRQICTQTKQRKDLVNLDVFAFLLLSPATNLAVMDLVAREASSTFARLFGYAYFSFALAAFESHVGKRFAFIVLFYACGCACIDLYANCGGHQLVFGDSLPFLPKILVSTYAFVGVASSYTSLIAR